MPTLTAKQYAALHGVSARLVTKWCQTGALKASKHGRDWSIQSDELCPKVGVFRGNQFVKPYKKCCKNCGAKALSDCTNCEVEKQMQKTVNNEIQTND